MNSNKDNLKYLKTLIIDNYDSYTFNLLQLFDNTNNVVVIRNDQFTWNEFTKNILPHFDNIIISPGPGRPEREADFGICTEIIKAQLNPNQTEYHRPIFGVCLGHQGIGHILGGKITHTPRIMHGRMSQLHYQKNENTVYKDIMYDCSFPFWVVRYHSLVVDLNSLPEDLLLTAYCYENDLDMEALKNTTYLADTEDVLDPNKRFHFLNPIQNLNEVGPITVMGFQHKLLPIWGVQFHPESVSTENGIQMIHNFQIETKLWANKNHRPISIHPIPSSIKSLCGASPKILSQITLPKGKNPMGLYVKTYDCGQLDPTLIVKEIMKTDTSMGWLDSSQTSSVYSKFSTVFTDPALTFTYSTLHQELRYSTRSDPNITRVHVPNLFDHLTELLEPYRQLEFYPLDQSAQTLDRSIFNGGLVGYLGYEMKRQSLEGYQTPSEQACETPCRCFQEPDSAFQLVDRFLILKPHQIYLCCIESDPDRAQAWFETQSERLMSSPDINTPREIKTSDEFKPDCDHEAYLDSIERCLDSIREGEAYEICLTTRFRIKLPTGSAWRLYTDHLRKNNPAPFSALMRFREMMVMSSSPERFLRVRDGVAEMKPIKGTAARVRDCVCLPNACDRGPVCQQTRLELDEQRKQQLWQDVKERAENLMIVDLIRNDLAHVCEPKTVCVPKLMHVETYEKVHHLVSTVQGKLHPQVNSVQVLKACFPPGSMTGAPKLRSVQLLDALEGHRPRGVYSGCLGYFSFNGNADFNVVIRTAVVTPSTSGQLELSVGGGGAITFLSDPEQEWKETVLKTKSVAPSVKEFLES